MDFPRIRIGFEHAGLASEQRLGETGWKLFDLNYGRGLPYDLREEIALNMSSFCVLEDSWRTKGAQESPFCFMTRG